MNSSSPPTMEALTEGVQHLQLVADKFPLLLTPPPSDDSAKSQKSTSNHSDHAGQSLQEKNALIVALKGELESMKKIEGFKHVVNLLQNEILRLESGDYVEEHPAPPPVQTPLVSSSGSPMLSEIVMVPVDKYPTYNFVGRILGPRGGTAKQLESTTGCRVTILGRNRKENGVETSAPIDNGPLRIQVSVPSDAPYARQRLETGVSVVEALLIPPADGHDELKRQQLMVLANINGTYRPRTQLPSPTLHFPGAGDYGHQFQNLLPFGYRLPGKSLSHHDTTNNNNKLDCFNPKCAILRGLIEQNNCTATPKVEDILSVMHMYELMNRIRIANSSLFGRQEEQSKAQEIGNRMCSSIGVPRRNSTSSTPTAPGASSPSSSSGPTRRLYNVKARQQPATNNQTP